MNELTSLKSYIITLESDLESFSTLISRNDEKYFIEPHKDFMEASKFAVQSAVHLLESAECKFIFPIGNGKFRLIKIGENNLNGVEKFLLKQSVKSQQTITIAPHEMIFSSTNDPIGKSKQSILVVPLITEKSVYLGSMILVNKLTKSTFDKEDISLANAFANTFARLIYSTLIDPESNKLMVRFSSNLYNLLENLYLFKNNMENNMLLSEMIKVSRLINSTLDTNSLLESIMDSAKLVLKTEGASLMLIDKKTNELYFNVISGEKEKALKEIRVPLGEGIAGLTAQTKEPMIVNDAQNDERVYKEADEVSNFITRNMIACPLLVRNKVIGVIECINSIGREDFTKKDLELFKSFSEQAALAIHNRELIESLQSINRELKKKVHELSSLHEIGKVLISTRNEKDLFDSIVKIVADELQSDRVSIQIYNERKNSFDLIAHIGLDSGRYNQPEVHIDKTLAGEALRENKVIFTNELYDSPYSHFSNESRYNTSHCIVQPLVSGNQKYGVLNISEKIDGLGYSEDDYRLISTISNQLIKGIENFRLLEEKIEKRAYEKELEITSAIQKSILPSKKLKSPNFEMGVLSESAKIMGGDFYDFIQFDEENFSFSIADVSGKSLPAALFMAVTSSIIRTIGRSPFDPADVMHQSNNLIYKASQSGMFVTLFYTVYDASSRQLKYASAGHNEQLIYRPDTKDFEELHVKGAPLGVLPSTDQSSFAQGVSYLRPGDLLVLYTDGVIEAINTRKEEYGLERFKEVIEENYLLTADQMVKRIYREVSEWAGEEPQFDDFTLMVLKFTK